MEESTGTTRGKLYPAIDPFTGKPGWQVLVPKRLIDRAHKRGMGALLELHHSVSYVMQQPAAVFCGLLRDNEDDHGQTDGWCCYSGSPEPRYHLATGKPMPRGQRVLAVFMNKDREIYTFGWEEEDEYAPGLPSDRGPDRFKEQLL